MKLLHIVGARPQFIKAAMVSRAWKGSGEELILHTGQHYDENMSQLFFDELWPAMNPTLIWAWEAARMPNRPVGCWWELIDYLESRNLIG